MKKDLNKFGFFDLALFNYMFKSTLKNIGIYVCSLIYFLTIFVIVFIIPYFGGLSPNQVLLNPIVICIVVLVISILASILSISLFKSPIDDGTELLVVSKPLSRLEILNTKISIFLINTILLSIIGAIFSLFIFLNKNTISQNNFFISLGFFVGSIISFCFFGFLSLLISLFAKKIFVFISVCGLAMFFFLGTTLNSLISSNPIKTMNLEGKSISSNVWISDTQNRQPHISTLSNLETTYIEDSEEKLDDAWKLAKKRSNYYRNSYFDFGAQLGSFFLLIDNITYAEWLMSSMEYFSTPYDISFRKIDVLDAFGKNKYNISIKMKDNDFYYVDPAIGDTSNIPLPSKNDFNALPFVQRFFTFEIDGKKVLYEQSESNIYAGTWSSNLWDSTWSDFIKKSNETMDNNVINSPLSLSNVYERFLNYIIFKKEIRKNQFDKFSNTLIEVAKSALYKLVEKTKNNDGIENNFSRLNIFNLYDISKDIEINLKMSNLFVNYDKLLVSNNKFKKFIEYIKEQSKLSNLSKDTKVIDIVKALENLDWFKEIISLSKNKLELKVLLSLLSIYYPSKIDDSFIFDGPEINYVISNTYSWENNALNLNFIKNSKNPNELENAKVNFELPFYMYQFKGESNFYESTVVPTYNRKILLPIWIVITLSIAITSILLYYKRDFA